MSRKKIVEEIGSENSFRSDAEDVTPRPSPLRRMEMKPEDLKTVA